MNGIGFSFYFLFGILHKTHSAMKNVIVFLLSLTCLAAHAQYNQSRKTTKPSLLTYYNTQKASKTLTPLLKIPAQPSQTVTTQTPGYSMYTKSATGPATQQGYWSGSQMTTSGMNGRFQSIQSFDMNGNLRETKATYQFTNRKKR
jgi:hypothetical protein